MRHGVEVHRESGQKLSQVEQNLKSMAVGVPISFTCGSLG